MPLSKFKETLLTMVMQCAATAMEDWNPIMVHATDLHVSSSSEEEQQGDLQAPGNQAAQNYRLDSDSAAGSSIRGETREWTRE